MYFQLIGYGPDLDPATPGVMEECVNLIPQEDGFEGAPYSSTMVAMTQIGAARSFAAAWANSTAIHTVVASYASDQSATTCTVYEIASQGTATARTTYTAGTYTTPVIFRQFDGEMFVARQGSPMKSADIATDFTAVTGAPSCALFESTKDFIVAFDTDTGYDWHCCAIGNGHDWSLSVSNQCVRGLLWGKSGPIVAAKRFGEVLLAFTRTQGWIGRYVGAPDVWQWEEMQQKVGCVGPEAIVETPYGCCWVSANDIHLFDGSSISKINTQPIRRQLFNVDLERRLAQYVACVWDSRREVLWVFYPAAGTSVLQTRPNAYIYNFGTKKWGKATLSNLRAVNQLQVDQYSYTATTARYDDMLYVEGGALSDSPTIMRQGNADLFLQSSFSTHWIGDQNQFAMIRGARPRFSKRNTGGFLPPEASVNTRIKELTSASASTATAYVALNTDNNWLMRSTGRWHRVNVRMYSGDVISGIDVDLVPTGRR